MTGRASADEHRRWLREELTAAVRHLADTADGQIAYLQELGSPGSADELALEFDDIAGAAVGEADVLSQEQAAMVGQIAERLDEMSGPDRAKLWTPDALRSASEWEDVRARASRLLATLEASPA